MNENERQAVATELSASRERLLGVVEGLTPEQWTFHPAEGRWSIGECVEHVTAVENRIAGLIGGKLAGLPDPEHESPQQGKDAEILKLVVDRTNRREAPEHVRPTGKWTDTNSLIDKFHTTRLRTEQIAAEADANLRNYFIPHGYFGELDCYQWLLVLGGHAERHARQIEEIKADAGFPRGGARAT